jgi:hypothetical protein
MLNQFIIHNSHFTANSQRLAINCKLLIESMLSNGNCKLKAASKGVFDVAR